MSIHVMTRVWERSLQSGGNLLVLLAIADYADEGGSAYPAVSTLARKCRMSTRNANLCLVALKAAGELEVRTNEGPKGTNRYRVLDGQGVKPASAPRTSKPLKPSSAPTPEAHFTPEAGFTLMPTSCLPEADFPIPLKPASDKPSLNLHQPSIKEKDISDAGASSSAKPTRTHKHVLTVFLAVPPRCNSIA